LIEGLSAEVVAESPVVSGQRILLLTAVGADGRHALSARFGALPPGGTYRATAWVKVETGAGVMIEARDSRDPDTGRPSNYGVAQFNLTGLSIANLDACSMASVTGDILSSGVDAAADDWVKLWVELRSTDGQIFVLIGLLEEPSNRHVFKATDQAVTFGGFEISHSQSTP
jgi:hypothetical protein